MDHRWGLSGYASVLNVPLDGWAEGNEELELDLVDSERLELLAHRCFVRCPKPHADRWPYDWSAIQRPNEPLRLVAVRPGGR